MDAFKTLADMGPDAPPIEFKLELYKYQRPDHKPHVTPETTFIVKYRHGELIQVRHAAAKQRAGYKLLFLLFFLLFLFLVFLPFLLLLLLPPNHHHHHNCTRFVDRLCPIAWLAF